MKKTNLFSSLFSCKRTKKKYKQKQIKSRKSKGGASSAATTYRTFGSTLIDNPELVFEIKPGQTFKFFGYTMKFYDFALMSNNKEVKDSLIKIKNYETACHDTIGWGYFRDAVYEARFAITLTFMDEGIEHYDSFIIGDSLNDSDTDFYTLLTCSRIIMSPKKKMDDIKAGVKNPDGIISLSFGLVLRCIMLQYAKTLGFTHAYNDSVPNLLSYYTKFGFRLGKEKCGTKDKLTDEHVLAIKDDEKTKRFYKKMLDNKGYQTISGFRMKLCDFNKGEINICEYAHKKLRENWHYLEKYNDIYKGYLTITRKITDQERKDLGDYYMEIDSSDEEGEVELPFDLQDDDYFLTEDGPDDEDIISPTVEARWPSTTITTQPIHQPIHPSTLLHLSAKPPSMSIRSKSKSKSKSRSLVRSKSRSPVRTSR